MVSSFETAKTAPFNERGEHVAKDIKESCNRLELKTGPWSSWLTPCEAKRRFPHAEEIAGSNPAGPTTLLR